MSLWSFETVAQYCRQAEELKQLVDEASWCHMGRQCQYSAVICSGTLLLSSRVLHLSLVMLSSHKSDVDVQLNFTMHLISGTLCSTPLCLLPVLSNIEPPALQSKAAADKLVEIVKHGSWPIQAAVTGLAANWHQKSTGALEVGSGGQLSPCVQPTIQPLGFDLSQQQWSLLNCFHMEQGHCSACRRKWRLTDTDLCPCGETRTMSYIVESCPLTKLNGGLSRLHSADEDAVSWLTNYGSWHTYKKKKK